MKKDTNTFNALFDTFIGFEQLFQDADRFLSHGLKRSYPPHNITKTDERSYEICVALAGFAPEDVEIEVVKNILHIRTVPQYETQSESADFAAFPIKLYTGISKRSFDLPFTLQHNMKVQSAKMDNGLLRVVLETPKAEDPQSVKIKIG